MTRRDLGGRLGPAARGEPAAKAPAAGPTAPTAIIAALPAELRGVLDAAVAPRRERPQRSPHRPAGSPGLQGLPRGERTRRQWTRATLAGEEVVLATTGDGAAAAAAGIEALLAAVRPRRLLVLGVSGGLTPGLASGVLLAARRVVDEDGAAAPQAPDPAWLAQAVAGGAVAGVAVSARAIQAAPAAKRRLLRSAMAPAAVVGVAGEAEAAWPPAAVDLESLAYARGAAAHGVPYLVVRAVLDPAEETLPLDFEACRTAGGQVSNTRVVLRALARPGSFRALWRLRARLAEEAARLAALAQRLMALPAAAAEEHAAKEAAAEEAGGARAGGAPGATEPGRRHAGIEAIEAGEAAGGTAAAVSAALR